MSDGNDFGWALEQLRDGLKVMRSGWNGKGMWICIIDDGKAGTSAMQPFIMMKTAQDTLVPWLASQTDVLAEDWLRA